MPTPTELKAQWRARLLRARRERPVELVDAAGQALVDGVLLLARQVGAKTIAAYLSMPGEPPTGPALRALHEEGGEVLVPVVLADRDLDWILWRPGLVLAAGPAGNPEPTGATQGADALGRADLVLTPGLAVDRAGTRLGRGGGSFDRALHRVRPGVLVAVLLFDDELVQTLPTEAHDRPVDVAITPSGLHRLRARRGGPHRPLAH